MKKLIISRNKYGKKVVRFVPRVIVKNCRAVNDGDYGVWIAPIDDPKSGSWLPNVKAASPSADVD